MKNPQQLKELIEENDIYHKKETDDYILLYAEFPTFIFIDYLLVTSNVRGLRPVCRKRLSWKKWKRPAMKSIISRQSSFTAACWPKTSYNTDYMIYC
jgi:hypothetical protein